MPQTTFLLAFIGALGRFGPNMSVFFLLCISFLINIRSRGDSWVVSVSSNYLGKDTLMYSGMFA